MCSIVIAINENRPEILKSMATAVKHRGPDTFEIRTEQTRGIAGCRLSIFGDSEAPMVYQDPDSGRIVLLNGEVYNCHELWTELGSRGIRPRTDLESELIAKLYDIHGLSFAALLKGMFALAILDGDELILARDRFGIKPLYYTRVDKKFLVCSEIKGLLRHPAVSPDLNQSALEETRVFGYVHSREETFFKNIYQVVPGTVTRFRDGQPHEELRFGVLPQARYLNGGPVPDYEECVQKTRELVIQAVDRMLRHGSMSKAVYLSGGLDSTTIAYVGRRLLGHEIHTFTLADNSYTPDFQAAGQVAKALGTNHHEHLVRKADYWRWLPDYVAHYESLMAGGVFHIQGGLAFHLMTKHVADRVRVAFSGEGADELFGGYYWVYTHPLGFSDRIRHNLTGLEGNRRLVDIVENLFPRPESETTYRRNLFDDLLRSGLTNYHLQSVDRSGGAFGIEIRPVYLDDDLSQWAMELPIEYKVPDKRTTKRILRDAFLEDYRKLGLDWVGARLKMGMPSAIADLDALVTRKVEQAITDDELKHHPYGHILGSKMNLLLFDLFEHIFFENWDHHEETPPPNSLLARVWPG